MCKFEVKRLLACYGLPQRIVLHILISRLWPLRICLRNINGVEVHLMEEFKMKFLTNVQV